MVRTVQPASFSFSFFLSPPIEFACPPLMVSVDIENTKITPLLREEAGQHRMAELTNKKAPSVFISVTSGRSAITLLNAKQGASPAKGGKKKKNCDGENRQPGSASDVCIH